MRAIRNFLLALGLTAGLFVGTAPAASARSVSTKAMPSAAPQVADHEAGATGPAGAVYLVVLVAGGGAAFTGRKVRINRFG